MTATTLPATRLPAQRSESTPDRALVPPGTAGPSAAQESGRGVLRLLRDRSVNTKIMCALSALALTAVAVGAVGVQGLSALDGHATTLFTTNLKPLQDLAAAQQAVGATRLDVANHGTAATPSERADLVARITADDGQVDAAINAYRPLAADPATVEAFTTAWVQYRQIRDTTLLPADVAGDTAGARTTRMDVMRPIATSALEALTAAGTAEASDANGTLEQIHSAYGSARMIIVGVLLAGLAAALTLGLVVARMIVQPLRRVGVVLGALAAGDLTARADVDGADEVGQMARALTGAQNALAATMTALAGNAATLAAASEEMSATAGTLAGSAEETSAQSGVVSAAAEQVSRNVQTVATGAEQMGASIAEISQNAADAARVGGTAVEVAEATTATVARLGDSSQQIGEVVKAVTGIAAQTNLLALNATIEAARAGEAGKGFAVVAHEVKDLAQETARATEDIGRRVQAIQADTAGAVAAIGEISSVIARMNDYQTTIASAVEEQTATTQEMTRNVAEAATGSTQIAENISGVAQAAHATSQGVSDTQQAAAELARMSSDLQALVDNFRY